MPASIAISTTISDALIEYSHQRAGLTPRAMLRRYQRRAHGLTTARWSTAASSRNAHTARSTRRSNRLAGPP